MTRQRAQRLSTTRAEAAVEMIALVKAADTEKPAWIERKAAELQRRIGPEIAPQDLSDDIGKCRSVFWTPEGKPIHMDRLPASSERLTRPQARAVFECFNEQIEKRLTCGQLSLLFEQYVLYAVGNKPILSQLQKDLVIWLCIAIRKRPLPTLWSAQFVFENVDTSPMMVRLVLLAKLWSQVNYKSRFATAFSQTNEWENLITEPRRQIRLLAVGYSESIAQMMAKVAERSDHQIIAYVPDLAELGRETTADQYYREQVTSLLPDPQKIKIEKITSDEVRMRVEEHKIDLVLLNAKAISTTADAATRIVESAACAKIIRDVRHFSVLGNAQPILVAGGIFKIWPTRLYDEYFDGKSPKLEELAPTDDAIIDGEDVTSIVTDIGWIAPRDLAELPGISYILHTENYVTAAAISLLQTEYKISPEIAEAGEKPRFSLHIGGSQSIKSNQYPLATERDCVILETIGDANKKYRSRDATSESRATVLSRQNQSKIEMAIKDAKSCLDQLLSKDDWYDRHRGSYIAISATSQPPKIVTAPDPDTLKNRTDKETQDIWYRCRIDRDEDGRAVQFSRRVRLAAGE